MEVHGYFSISLVLISIAYGHMTAAIGLCFDVSFDGASGISFSTASAHDSMTKALYFEC